MNTNDVGCIEKKYFIKKKLYLSDELLKDVRLFIILKPINKFQ